jgi:hypothetical protein
MQHLGIRFGIDQAGFVGMDADARPYTGILRIAIVLFCQKNAAVCGLRAITVPDRKISLDPILFRACQNLFAIAVVAAAFEMGVGVDEHFSLQSGLQSTQPVSPEASDWRNVMCYAARNFRSTAFLFFFTVFSFAFNV